MSPDVLLSPSHESEGTVDSAPVSGPLLTPVDTAQAMQLNDNSESSFTSIKQRDDKLPHDASVFVGSLPSNMDQGDLTRMLMDHLSEHTQIKNIKVVRDSKGGVCAFVQCENAASATALIQTLHASAPKPFLGRILRYEPARAFRALLVSYRMPTQFGHIHDPSQSPVHGQIELELPTAMRIWKHRNSRFHSILYNSDAIHAEEKFTNSTVDVPWNGLFLHPVHFDEGSLLKLASYFGPLENFALLEALDTNDVNDNEQANAPYSSYPTPHRFPRSSRMANGCWEIKWEHRDDCVSALMTLRRVPHLTVTWAHQPAPAIQGTPSTYKQNSFSLSYSPQNLHRSSVIDTFTSQTAQMPYIFQVSKTSGNTNKEDVDQGANSLVQEDPNEMIHHSWTEDPSGEKRQEEKEISMLSLLPHIPLTERINPISKDLNHTRPQTSATFNGLANGDPANAESQEVYVPQTPGLEKSSITPTTPGSYFPATPTDIDSKVSHMIPRTGVDCKSSHDAFSDARRPREIDPTTLFVGGLEMFGPGAWDEEKVKTFFSRFGGLECVKVVRPLNSCAAFAFVKFNNTEAPARAVSEEHNRIYEGRAMRVQLRDCNPPRNSWKFNRGRGRPQNHHFSAQRRLPLRSSFGYQTGSVFSAHHEKNHLENPAKQSPLVLQKPPAVIRLQPRDDVSSTSGLVDSSPVDNTHISANSPINTETYREWYEDANSAVRTPEPSSLGSSASTSGIPFSASPSYGYPVSNGPFFPHPPWLHSYPPHMPYQVPYYPGYPLYPHMVQQQQHQALTGPPGSDHNAPTAGPGTQHNWSSMNMYTSYIPYPSMPSRTQLDQGQHTSHIPTQAPVVPTGFIQNEQGTLIAVYQPDVLDQYLAGAVPTMPTAPNYFAPNQQRCELPNSQLHEPENTSANPLSGHQNRPKSAGFPPPPPQQTTTPPRETDLNIPNTPLYRRQNFRREYQHSHVLSRQQNHLRSGINGRPPRVHRTYPANTHPPDLGHHIAQPGLTGEWKKWNNLR